MKRVGIVLSLIIGIFLLTGCGMKPTAADAVKDLLNQYRNLSSNVLTDLEKVIEQEDFNENQEKVYKDALKKQYSDLKYEIVNETYNGDNAIVEAKIIVYDFYKVQNDASEYLANNQDKFLDEFGEFDNNLFLDYKLDQMKKTTDTVEYTINFDVAKNEDGNWEVLTLNQFDLEKIHGIYNYDE